MASPLFVKLDVTWVDHPSLIVLGMEARGVHATALCLAKRLETDGWVARVQLLREGATPEVIDKLVEAGLVDDDGAGNVRPSEWHDRNPSQGAIDASRASKSDSGKLGNHVRYKHPGALADCRKCNRKPQVTRSSDRKPSHRLALASPETETETETEKEKTLSRETELFDHPDPASPASPDECFETWWKQYPRRTAKAVARKAFLKQVKTHDPAVITAGLQRWLAAWAEARTEKDFMPYPATFLNQERFLDENPSPPKGRGQAAQAIPNVYDGNRIIEPGGDW